MTHDEAIDAAVERAKAEFAMNPASDAHTVGRGLIAVGDTEIEGVVVTVTDKVRAYASDQPAIPRCYSVEGYDVVVHVEESPLPTIARLDLSLAPFSPFAANDLQRCHACPIPGGAQIAPAGAQWVGTLGCAIQFDGGTASNGKPWGTLYGALTNYHVAHGGKFPTGTQMLQPGPGSQWFARLHKWCPLNFSGGINKIDAALLNCRRTDGAYAPQTDTVKSEQFGVGLINPSPLLDPPLGTRVIKVGRTTAVTRGRLTQKNVGTTVDYGPEGAAKYDGQYVFSGDQGDLSQPGDSGSLILEEGTLRPVSLLFAGGGGQTIGNKIGDVLAWAGAQFFKG